MATGREMLKRLAGGSAPGFPRKAEYRQRMLEGE